MTATPVTKQHIDDFLRRIHLGAEVYYVGQLCDTWQLSTTGGDATTFHLVCHGTAWIHMADFSHPKQLSAGDIALFPHDAAHAISGLPTISADAACHYGNPTPFDHGEPGTGLICGHLKLPTHVRRLLLSSFPGFLLIRADQGTNGSQLRDLIGLMSSEAAGNDFATSAILDRLSDTLFLYVIRQALRLDPKLSPLLAALTDDNLRLAVSAFIENPAEFWSVDRMAKLSFQSRSTFAARFTELVKMPPMEFVAAWRMQLAFGWLSDSHANMLDIALKCGYESEAGFRKAFKRIIGVTPGQARNNGPSVQQSV